MRLFGGKGRSRGQATTEMVLLFPLFMFFMFGTVKIFAVLVLVQKVEIASFYAARAWELESHRNINWEGFDNSALLGQIQKTVQNMLGCGPGGSAGFLDVDCKNIRLSVTRTQVWNVVKLQVPTKPWKIPLMQGKQLPPFVVTKYVPNRDRPIGFNLPGI